MTGSRAAGLDERHRELADHLRAVAAVEMGRRHGAPAPLFGHQVRDEAVVADRAFAGDGQQVHAREHHADAGFELDPVGRRRTELPGQRFLAAPARAVGVDARHVERVEIARESPAHDAAE